MSPAVRKPSPRLINAPISAGERRAPCGECAEPRAVCGSAASRGAAAVPGAFGRTGGSDGGGAAVGDADAAGNLSDAAGGAAGDGGSAGCDGRGTPGLGASSPGEGADSSHGTFTPGAQRWCRVTDAPTPIAPIAITTANPRNNTGRMPAGSSSTCRAAS